MRNMISILLMLFLLSVLTPAGQLLKIPMLVTHFVKHQKQEGCSFFAFLQDHYSADHNDGDRQDDEQLPFRNMDYYAIGYAVLPGVIKAGEFFSFFSNK